MGFTTGTKWTYETVKEYIEGEGYKLISTEYKNMREKLNMICPKRHDVWVSFDCFKRMEVRCAMCSREQSGLKRRTDIKEVREIIESIEGYTLLSSEYIPKKKLKIKHECRNEYDVSLNNFKRGRRCPVCQIKKNADKLRLDKDIIIKTVTEAGYKLISMKSYKNTSDKITVECPNGHIYDVVYNNFSFHGRRCPECYKLEYCWTHDKFKHEVEKINPYIEIVGRFNKLADKVSVICKSCNHQWEALAFPLLYGTGCPRCKISKGEKRIEQYLIHNNFKYEMQCKFDGLKYKQKLAFDFCVRVNAKLVLIEYNGRQHYELVNFGTTDEKAKKCFKDGQIRDNMKIEYCKKNNYKLITIPYWDFDNIEEILTKELQQSKNFND